MKTPSDAPLILRLWTSHLLSNDQLVWQGLQMFIKIEDVPSSSLSQYSVVF